MYELSRETINIPECNKAFLLHCYSQTRKDLNPKDKNLSARLPKSIFLNHDETTAKGKQHSTRESWVRCGQLIQR